MRALSVVLVLAACGDSSPAKPDAPVQPLTDAPPDTAACAVADADATFGACGVVNLPTTCRAFAVDAQDRPFVVTNDAGNNATLVGYDTAGHLQTMRAIGGGPIEAASLFVLPGGGLLVTGMISHSGGNPTETLWDIEADGTTQYFQLELPQTVGPIVAVGQRADGSFDLVGIGSSGSTAFAFVRVSAAGALVTGFGDNGVASPVTNGIPPGYFPHAISLGNGTFALSGASFAPIDQQGGVGPVTAHLMLAADGVITSTTTTENTQILGLASFSDKLYGLTTAFPSGIGSIQRFDNTLAVDPTFTAAEASTYNPSFGLYNGGTLAVAPNGSLIATNGTTLDRVHPDGTARSTDDYAFSYCGLAFDSMNRPLVAGTTTILRLVP